MKAKVIKSFQDKNTKEKHYADPPKVIEVTEKRFKEINRSEHGPHLEEVKEDAE